jgi:integrase
MLYRRGDTWWFEFVFRGQRIRESSGSRSKTVARDARDRRRRDLIDAVNGLKKRRTPLLFRTAAESWLEAKKAHWSPAMYRIESKAIDHLLPTFGGLLIIDIGADDVARYQASRKSAGAAAATINMEVATLRAILRKHQLWAALQPDVHRLDDRKDVGVSLSAKEEGELLTACLASRSRALYPAVALALYTGLRRAELLGLRWDQIDLGEKTLQVGDSKTEAGRGRMVPLNGKALEVLKDWAAQFPNRKPAHAVFPSEQIGASGHVFAPCVTKTTPGEPIGSLKQAWETAKKKSKVDCRWHDLRHTACTRLLDAGVSLPVVATLMGWSDSTAVRMARRYGHIGHDAKRDAMLKLDVVRPPKSEEQEAATSQPGTVH